MNKEIKKSIKVADSFIENALNLMYAAYSKSNNALTYTASKFKEDGTMSSEIDKIYDVICHLEEAKTSIEEVI